MEQNGLNEKYLISIIVPVYNAENTIKHILECICHQTYKNLEIIIVNDGSSDKSEEIIKENPDQRIRYFAKENGGVSSARNIGLSEARGEFIRFIDADDRIPLDSIENMIRPFYEFPSLDLVIGNFLFSDTYNYFIEEKYHNQLVDFQNFSKMVCKAPKSFYYGVPWNKLYRKNIIDEIGLRFDEKLKWCEDFVFNLSYYLQCKQFYLLNIKDGIYMYLDNPESLTKKIETFSEEESAYIKEQRNIAYKAFTEASYCSENMTFYWSGTELYGKLSSITKVPLKEKSFFVKLDEFKKVLLAEGMYNYIVFMSGEANENARLWKMLKKAIERNNYLFSYLYFAIKGYYVRFLSKVMPKSFTEKLKKKTPKAF